MAASNPQVSVFHFTSRISSAKIRKYKLATERGMGGGGGSGMAGTPTSRTLQTTPSPAEDPSSMEPPAKRPKLKLNVRPPNESPDTIAVSRPKRESSLRIRYSENMTVDSKALQEQAEDDDEVPRRKSRPSPAVSDLSSLTSVRSLEKGPDPARVQMTSSAKQRDYSRDFMSYYVDGGDDEVEEPPEATQPVPQPPELRPSKPASALASMPPPPSKEKAPKQRAQAAAYPTPKLPPRRPHLPQPVISIVDDTLKPPEAQVPTTIAVMVKKLEALSTALTNFGGIPAIPESPQEVGEAFNTLAEPPAGEKKEVDNFLAMFDDDDSDEKDGQHEKNTKITESLGYILATPGDADTPLSYGIHFIQNALRSWAAQRTSLQYSQQCNQYLQSFEMSQKRGPGRPRKFDNGEEDLHVPAPSAFIRLELAKTPEGAAISAFQDVLAAGCLQVNAKLPLQLTRALRRLYMQIDHLINQGSRKEPAWQCMSYGSQIAAQRTRVDKWKIAHAKAQEEMARQHHLAQQQVMQQMGIPYHQRGHLTVAEAQQQHAIDLERKRNLQHAAQQPHLTQYLANPLRLNTNPAAVSASKHTMASPVETASANSPGAGAANGASQHAHSFPPHASPAEGKGVHLDKIKLYVPNFLPRSGQSMKFSFAPHNELALQTFGAQAFPTNQTGPNLPNRGPISANPHMPMNHAHIPNGSISAPAMPSTVPSATEYNDSDVEMIDAVATDGHLPVTHTTDTEDQLSAASHSTPQNIQYKLPTVAAGNYSTSGGRASSLSAESPKMPPNEIQNAHYVFSGPVKSMGQPPQVSTTQTVVID